MLNCVACASINRFRRSSSVNGTYLLLVRVLLPIAFENPLIVNEHSLQIQTVATNGKNLLHVLDIAKERRFIVMIDS